VRVLDFARRDIRPDALRERIEVRLFERDLTRLTFPTVGLPPLLDVETLRDGGRI
jgi:hypothetical protein